MDVPQRLLESAHGARKQIRDYPVEQVAASNFAEAVANHKPVKDSVQECLNVLEMYVKMQMHSRIHAADGPSPRLALQLFMKTIMRGCYDYLQFTLERVEFCENKCFILGRQLLACQKEYFMELVSLKMTMNESKYDDYSYNAPELQKDEVIRSKAFFESQTSEARMEAGAATQAGSPSPTSTVQTSRHMRRSVSQEKKPPIVTALEPRRTDHAGGTIEEHVDRSTAGRTLVDAESRQSGGRGCALGARGSRRHEDASEEDEEAFEYGTVRTARSSPRKDRRGGDEGTRDRSELVAYGGQPYSHGFEKLHAKRDACFFDPQRYMDPEIQAFLGVIVQDRVRRAMSESPAPVVVEVKEEPVVQEQDGPTWDEYQNLEKHIEALQSRNTDTANALKKSDNQVCALQDELQQALSVLEKEQESGKRRLQACEDRVGELMEELEEERRRPPPLAAPPTITTTDTGLSAAQETTYKQSIHEKDMEIARLNSELSARAAKVKQLELDLAAKVEAQRVAADEITLESQLDSERLRAERDQEKAALAKKTEIEKHLHEELRKLRAEGKQYQLVIDELHARLNDLSFNLKKLGVKKVDSMVESAGLTDFLQGGAKSTMMQVFLRLYADAMLRLQRLQELKERFRHEKAENQVKVLDAMYRTITSLAPSIMEYPDFHEFRPAEKDHRGSIEFTRHGKARKSPPRCHLSKSFHRARRPCSALDEAGIAKQASLRHFSKHAALPNLQRQPGRVDPPTTWFVRPEIPRSPPKKKKDEDFMMLETEED